MGYPRSHLVAADAPGWYHCTTRCVRRAFLCGVDEQTGRDYEHRRLWIADRILELAGIFAVGVYGYAVMSNHYHVVVRVDPDIAAKWSDEDVADRWVELFPRGDEARDRLHRDGLLADPERLALLRQRLGSLSWFMRCLNEPIARRANADDDVRGHFWEARFKCQALLDDHAVLAAMAYVDLNPVRAGIADGLEDSDYTSVRTRLQALRADHDAWQALAASIDAAARDPLPLRPVAGPKEALNKSPENRPRSSLRGAIPSFEAFLGDFSPIRATLPRLIRTADARSLSVPSIAAAPGTDSPARTASAPAPCSSPAP